MTDHTDAGSNGEERSPPAFLQVPNAAAGKWWKDPGLRKNVWHCLGLCGVTFMNGYDGSLMNGLQAMDQWQDFLGHPEGAKLGAISAALYIPSIVFSWFADIINARYGRRPVIWTGALFAIAGAIINGAAINMAMYAGGRAVEGVGIALCLATAPTLLQEIAHPRYRATVAGLCSTPRTKELLLTEAAFLDIASIASAWVTFGTLYMNGNIAWRLPCYLQVIGPIFIIVATIGCPESPRWLIEKGKSEKALHILTRYHANGHEGDELVRYQYDEIKAALALEKSSSQASYLDFLRTPANRHRLLILSVVGTGTNWVGNGIINYYLSPTLKQIGITGSTQIAGINAGLQIWNLIISTCAALLVERIGRRPLWLFFDCGMFLSFIFAMGLSGGYATTGNASVGIAVIPFLFLFFGSYDIAWTPLQYAYPVEILPYHMRMKGMALLIVIQALAVTINTFVNPIALAEIGWKYYGVYLAILAGFITVTYFYFPETKSMTIEEITTVFDKSDKVSAAALMDIQKLAKDEVGKGGQLQPSSRHVESAV
ncbi:general substrate transporter [Aspergillus insuetus]